MQSESPFRWTRQREEAAALVADDGQTDREIAAHLGINIVTLERWKLHPDFRARVAGIVEAVRAALEAEGIANKKVRVERLNARATKLDYIVSERAKHIAKLREEAGAGEPADGLAREPGADTGYLLRQYKVAGGRAPIVLEEYVVDHGTLTELRAIEKQAAQELGEWIERGELTGKDGEPLFKAYEGIDPARV